MQSSNSSLKFAHTLHMVFLESHPRVQGMTPHLKRMQERGVHMPNTERLSRTMQQLKAAIEV